MASEQVCVVATCFNEAELISAFMERVMALPEMEHLPLVDDGSSDATEAMGLAKLRRIPGPSSSTRWCERPRPCPPTIRPKRTNQFSTGIMRSVGACCCSAAAGPQ